MNLNRLSINSIKSIIGHVVAGLAFAGLFFAIQQNLILFNFRHEIVPTSTDTTNCHKQSVKIYFWKNQHWEFEKIEILWSNNLSTNLTNLTQAWLNQLEEEHLTRHKITLQSAMVSPNNQVAYLSLDQRPFPKQASTHQKLYLFESLLKTLRENNMKVSQVQLLLRHQTYLDPHLDFNRPWPISGFIK